MHWFSLSEPLQDEPLLSCWKSLSVFSSSVSTFYFKDHVVVIVVVASEITVIIGTLDLTIERS
jgi:hypothetical protein